MKTYLFYDVETTGLNPAFDQILTFACIRTDLSLNELDRQTITIQLRKDIVPSPRAFLTHGLTYEELCGGITEYRAAKKIHELVNTPGTISLGYNSLGFDDEFLRFLFYRNLLDPYSHQYGNGCSRMDILPITALFRVFHPNCLKWPVIGGKSSLKLDLIAKENRFVTSGRAHEAMNDVEALIALNKILYSQKDIWKYSLDFFNKTRDNVRINSINNDFYVDNKGFTLGIIVSASFGPQVNYIAPAVHIGSSVAYKNQSLWMRIDSEDILNLNGDISLDETFVTRKRFGDVPIIIPALERFWNKMSEETKNIAIANMEIIQNNSENFFEYIEHHQSYKYPLIPDLDIDAALYQDGFLSRDEKRQSEIFHKAQDKDKFNALADIKSPRIKKLASRIVARNFDGMSLVDSGFDDCLLLDVLRTKKQSMQIVGYKNDTKLSCENALDDLKLLEGELLDPDVEQVKMLLWLKEYIESL